MHYKTVRDGAESRFVERKSEFISYLRHVENEEQAVGFINEIKSLHRKATHNCYAYILRENNTARHSDDGEPQGTAGMPIFDVIRKEGLEDVACVVTRYFGGIMLGAGGLVRAYGRAASDAVNAAAIRDFHMAVNLKLTAAYPLYGRIKRVSDGFGAKIVDESFSDKVVLCVYIKNQFFDAFCQELAEICSGDIIVEKITEEFHDFG